MDEHVSKKKPHSLGGLHKVPRVCRRYPCASYFFNLALARPDFRIENIGEESYQRGCPACSQRRETKPLGLLTSTLFKAQFENAEAERRSFSLAPLGRAPKGFLVIRDGNDWLACSYYPIFVGSFPLLCLWAAYRETTQPLSLVATQNIMSLFLRD